MSKKATPVIENPIGVVTSNSLEHARMDLSMTGPNDLSTGQLHHCWAIMQASYERLHMIAQAMGWMALNGRDLVHVSNMSDEQLQELMRKLYVACYDNVLMVYDLYNGEIEYLNAANEAIQRQYPIWPHLGRTLIARDYTPVFGLQPPTVEYVKNERLPSL